MNKVLQLKIMCNDQINIIGKACLRIVLTFLMFCSFQYVSYSTHLVGGQLSYKCLGNGFYEIRLVVRRDCLNGADTVFFDNPAVIGAFYGDGQKAFRVGIDGVFDMDYVKNDTLKEKVDNFCVGKNQEVCVHEAIYTKRIFLPFDERGYILAYQRCCRNTSLSNVVDPLETGTTYAIKFSAIDLLSCNSNPQFGNFPPIYVCVNKPFVFDHSATDVDGDSLVYMLCKPNLGKTRLVPAGRPNSPPYDSVVFKSPYNLDDLMNGGSGGVPLKIDPVTGVLTANPNTLGQFLVGVCVLEYRNGKLLSYATRDFELNIVPCGITPVASFVKNSSLCDGFDQKFTSTSKDANNYQWFFDFINDRNLKSNDQNPSFRYSKSGNYEVVLVVQNGECTDTFRQTISIIDPGLIPDFNYKIDCSADLTISLKDSSQSNFSIVKYDWSLSGNGNNLTSVLKDPVFKLSNGGRITITLTITDLNGCTSMLSKTIDISTIDIELIGNETDICIGDSVRLVKNPNPRFTYTWSPTTGLDLSNPSNPLAKPNVTTKYRVTITDGNCVVEKEILVKVRGLVNLRIEGDTLTCDGNISLTANSDSTNIFEWSFNRNFIPLEFTGVNFKTKISGNRIVYVRAGSKDQCQVVLAIQLLDKSILLNYPKQVVICSDDTTSFKIEIVNPGDQITIEWSPSPLIVSSANSLMPVIFVPEPGIYVLKFKATNQFNCTLTDSILVNAVSPPDADFKIDYECGSLKVVVTTSGNRNVSWDFGDGKGKAFTPMAMYTYNASGNYKITLKVDSVCERSITKEITIVDIDITLKDSILSCFGSTVELNPGGTNEFVYKWSPIEGLNDPNSPNPSAKVTKTTTYYVDIFDPNFPGCSKKDTITVFVPDRIELEVSGDTLLCESVKLKLFANSSNPLVKIIWCDQTGKEIGSGNSILVEPKETQLYQVKAEDEYGCVEKDTILVRISFLKAELKGPSVICLSDTAMITIMGEGNSKYTYDWSPKESIIGSSTGSKIIVNPTVNTTYSVEIRDTLGCSWTLTHNITVNDPSKNIFALADPVMIVPGYKSQLTTVDMFGYKYKWGPDDGSLSDDDIFNPVAMPSKTTTYVVTVTDEAGCTATASVVIMVKLCEDAVFIPNAFSPNGDSKNDFFLPRSQFITKMNMVIYNRWGQKLFETSEQLPGWDGTFKGERLGPDVFGYLIKFKCFENSEYTKKGNVSIIK
ncbi:MAG: gliding motility-associated C-terminal domain-containing protein [Saprospiraceae bacterium]|nr:gliding motility-associated C-terminal domain-containing protein [Candidatus Vicinibacter affinis]